MSIHAEDELKQQYSGFLQMPNIFSEEKLLLTKQYDTNCQSLLSLTPGDVSLLNKHIYLGKRAEYFMYYYLKQQKNITHLYHSIQIKKEKTTIGEIDFLFFDEEVRRWIHLELVTKFYIYNSDEKIENYHHWIGPNLKDKFEFKLNKLKNHQLTLLKLPESRYMLNELKIDMEELETQICYKAKLFLPPKVSPFKHQTTNPECIYGKYFNIEQFNSLRFSDYLYYVPQKLEWVCSPKHHKYWYDYNKASDIVKNHLKAKRSCLLWRKCQEGNYYEDFIVWWS